MYNRCPHRGAQICSARKGNAGKLFRCSYHAWMFELDGKLDSVPGAKGYEGTRFDPNDPAFHLRKAPRAENYRGFWFASLAEDGADLETHLGRSKLALDQLVDRSPDGEIEVVGDCFHMIQQSNWKIFLENQIDVSHPGATHESTGAAARSVENEMKRGGEDPPMSYGFLSDFVRHGIDGWDKFGTTGLPQGHCTLEGYMGLRPDDPDTNEYVRRMYESYGEERTEEILGVDLHHVLLYPCNSVQPPLQQLRTIRPLSPNRTLSEIWHFRLKGAPEAIYQRSLAYYYLVNSPFDDGQRRRFVQLVEMPARAGEQRRRMGELPPQRGPGQRGRRDHVFRAGLDERAPDALDDAGLEGLHDGQRRGGVGRWAKQRKSSRRATGFRPPR